MENNIFEEFRATFQRALASMDEERVLCEEANLRRMMHAQRRQLVQNQMLMFDIEARIFYLDSIKPENIIERANHGDLAGEGTTRDESGIDTSGAKNNFNPAIQPKILRRVRTDRPQSDKPENI